MAKIHGIGASPSEKRRLGTLNPTSDRWNDNQEDDVVVSHEEGESQHGIHQALLCGVLEADADKLSYLTKVLDQWLSSINSRISPGLHHQLYGSISLLGTSGDLRDARAHSTVPGAGVLLYEFNESLLKQIKSHSQQLNEFGQAGGALVGDDTGQSSHEKQAGGALSETNRQALLSKAVHQSSTATDPIRALEEHARSKAVELLGSDAVLGLAIRSEEDLLQALSLGFPGQVLRSLQDAGYPHVILEQVIAPRRTLMRRRSPGERLTRGESDAAWRLAYALALASKVLNGPKAALDWLTRPKPSFREQRPIDLLETSVGTAAVERMLKQLDWGDVA